MVGSDLVEYSFCVGLCCPTLVMCLLNYIVSSILYGDCKSCETGELSNEVLLTQVLSGRHRVVWTMPFTLTQYLHSLSFPSFKSTLIVSILLRVALILYSEWHDAHSVVKYTDIDYRVFSDAARFVLHPTDENRAQGPLGQLLAVGEYVAWYPSKQHRPDSETK